MYLSCLRWFLMDCKIGMILLSLYYPFAFFGVLRTFFAKKVLSRRRQNRHRRFAKCCTALSELNPQKPVFGCKQLSGWLLLSRYQKTGVHAAYSPSASLSACSALSEVNPQKPAFGCKQLSGRLLLPRYQKSPYMPPIRLRRR